MTHSDGGKGSDRRPGEGYADGWERIFGSGVQRKPALDKDSALHAPHLLSTCSEGAVQVGCNQPQTPEGLGWVNPAKG